MTCRLEADAAGELPEEPPLPGFSKEVILPL
jgi:hypothetical protein